MSDDLRRPKRHHCPSCESSHDHEPPRDSHRDHHDEPYHDNHHELYYDNHHESYHDNHHESYHNHHHPRPPIDRCSPMPPWESSEPHRRPPRPPRNW